MTMNPYASKKIVLSLILFHFFLHSFAQTQDDFMAKLSDVYVNTGDKKKALEIAKDLHKMVEQNKSLQTYQNYLMLTQIFENQAPDAALAQSCKAEAEKLLNAMIGATPASSSGAATDPGSVWTNEYFSDLFSTKDPNQPMRALQFLSKHPSLQVYNNYYWVAYAFERTGDFQRAKENYELALTKTGNEKEEHHTYIYYINFLARSGEYLKAEELIEKLERLSEQANNDLLKVSYKSESITSKVFYYLAIGDLASYIEANKLQYAHYTRLYKSATPCDPFSFSLYTTLAHANEVLGNYSEAADGWRARDSAYHAWVNCHNSQYPNNKQYPLSSLPVYQIKTGKRSALTKPASFYIDETEAHYESYKGFGDIQTRFQKGTQLAFLGAPQYHTIFKEVIDHIVNTKDFSHSTTPLAYYAYFTMRDNQHKKSAETYAQLFNTNVEWINDVIFSFGEKAFVTYYNTKLKDGYDNYHSFVKIAKEKKSDLFPQLSSQAYNNLLLTKSLSLKGTQKRKAAFRKANDPATLKMYDEWIDKKQQLIRLYRKTEDATPGQESVDREQLKNLQEGVNHLENELAIKAKDFKKYLKLTPPDWKTIRSKLKEGEAAVEMIRFQWRDKVYYSDSAYYAAYYITKNSTHPDVVYLSSPAADLENRHYKQYQNSIKFKLQDKNSYQHYWKPVLDQLKGIKKVYLSPDGIYHLISLPTLLNPETGKYLLDEMDIQYTTSSLDLQDEVSNADIRSAVLFGRPTYEVKSTNGKILSPASAETRSFVANFRDNSISDLPGTEEEVLVIKKEMENRSVNVSLYLHDQASEEKMYALHSPDVIHIATHGYWSPAGNAATDGYRMFNAMVNSGLLMSGVVNYYKQQEFANTYDGILTAYEAQNLDLENTSLVILSACETSLGHMDAGEGVYGLQRAFRAAGAKSIMTSLWKVDDAATKEFMILFYQNYLATKNKFEAFKAAQKQVMTKYPEPYYWGAFTLTGR